jgi:hypothetical protein
MFEKGDCFLVETNLDSWDHIQSHLFITILEVNENEIVLVNIDKTRGKSKYDTTVILNTGEGHEFVKEPSYVNYRKAVKHTQESLEIEIDVGTIKYKGRMKIETVEKIKSGVLKSKVTPFEIREIFEDGLYDGW